MPRDNYWEMTHDPDGASPTVSVDLEDIEEQAGYRNKVIKAPESGDFLKVGLRKKGEQKVFEKCDFTADVKDSDFTNCTFDRCSAYFGESFHPFRFKVATYRSEATLVFVMM